MRLLRWYILRLHVVPFLVGFGVVTFILVMETLFDYLDLIVNRGVAVGLVLQLFALSLGYIIALSVPCAVLVAALMTFGRLSQDNEITALRASGVSLGSVLIAPLAAAALLTVGLTLFNNHVLPETNHSFANLLIGIHRMRPTVRLQEGVFITEFPGYNLLVKSVNGRTNEMRGVTIYQLNPGGPPTTITAKRGHLYYTPDGRTAVLELHDGEIHEVPADVTGQGRSKYRRLIFKTHVINILGAGGMIERTVRQSRSDRELSTRDLLRQRDTVLTQFRRAVQERIERYRAAGLRPEYETLIVPERARLTTRVGTAVNALLRRPPPTQALEQQVPWLGTDLQLWRVEREAYRKRIAGLSVEMHKKFSLPTACIVFVLLGAPIGMRVRRAGPAVAFISIAFFLFYWICLIGGEELANRLLLPPWLAMWLPNLVLGALGIHWTLRAAELRLPWARSRRGTPPAPARRETRAVA